MDNGYDRKEDVDLTNPRTSNPAHDNDGGREKDIRLVATGSNLGPIPCLAINGMLFDANAIAVLNRTIVGA